MLSRSKVAMRPARSDCSGPSSEDQSPRSDRVARPPSPCRQRQTSPSPCRTSATTSRCTSGLLFASRPVTHLREQDDAPRQTTTVPAVPLIPTQDQFTTTPKTTTQCLRSASSRGPRASAQSATQPSQDQQHLVHHHHHGHNHTPRPFFPPYAPTPQPSNKAPRPLACPRTSRPSSSASSAPWPTASPTRRHYLTNNNKPPPSRPPRRRGTQPHQTGQQRRRRRLQQQQNHHHQPTSPPQAACGAAPRPSSTARGTPRRARSAGPRRSR